MENKFLISETASADIDAQKGFTIIAPGLIVVNGELIVVPLNEQAKYARLRVGSKDWHPLNGKWLSTLEEPQYTPIIGEKNLDIRWDMHCPAGEIGSEFLDGLPPVTGYDFIAYKGLEPDMHPYGACYHDLEDKMSTGLIEYLQGNDIKNVIVGGLATDYCVKLTALQLKNKGFNVILNLEACRGVTEETTNNAIQEMKDFGIVVIEATEELSNLFE